MWTLAAPGCELLVETARSVAYTPLAPLNVGGDVNFNSTGFIDGVNHDHRIHLTGGGAAASVYGDAASETTADMALLGLLPTSVIDSPDDHDIFAQVGLAEILWLAALNYLGIGDGQYQSLLAAPDTTAAQMTAGQPPLGFTHVNGNYTLGAGTASPGTDQFGVMYVNGNLTVQGNHTFKGFIYVNGDVQIATGAHLTVLGAMMVRGTYTHVGTGTTTLLYSREAAIRGLLPTRPWRVLSWLDTALAGS